jgi:HTH-type transcriptional regulator, transcriptional repressor of NAD biosynthesis genes
MAKGSLGMTRGFLLGKFMPPHNGHVLLCETARALVDELTILVCWLPDDPIAGETRLGWMQQMFPDCHVIGHDKIVPQVPEDSPDFWPIWRAISHAACPYGIDFVFASEDYGQRLADEVGAQFWPVDIGRDAVPISASEIRADPASNWQFIPNAVRPYYTHKICLHGPESTGKSVLAQQLATHFETRFVPEYGRTYCEHFGVNLNASDLVTIGKTHHAITDAAMRQCNRKVILDTDPLMTAVWSDMMLGDVPGYARDPWLESFDDYADLYLLMDIDLPWKDDGTRIYGDASQRQHFFNLCKAELDARNVRYEIISGDGDIRFVAALAAIESVFTG